MRETAFTLARNSYTPVGYWMGLPLRQLGAWVETNNEVIGKINQSNEEHRSKRRR